MDIGIAHLFGDDHDRRLGQHRDWLGYKREAAHMWHGHDDTFSTNQGCLEIAKPPDIHKTRALCRRLRMQLKQLEIAFEQTRDNSAAKALPVGLWCMRQHLLKICLNTWPGWG